NMVRIGEFMIGDLYRSVSGVYLVVRREQMTLESRTVCDYLEDRPGRIYCLNGLILDSFSGRFINGIGIEGRIISESQYFAGLGVKHDSHPRPRLSVLNTALESLLDHVLIGRVDRQNDIAWSVTLNDRLVIDT